MNAVLFVNPRSGGGKAARAGLAERAREGGIDVVLLDGSVPLAALVEEAVAGGAGVLGVAGGDGSLGVVAAAAIAHDLPFVCVPAGTRNHFALDLGLDRSDPVAALDAFFGEERRIDVGVVNGRVFLNNVSLGVYGDAVHRPDYRDAKVRTLLDTAASFRGAGSNVQLVDDLGHLHRDPIAVLVSNNPYAPGPRPGGPLRRVLDGGTLGVVVVDAPRIGRDPARAWAAASLEVVASGAVAAGVDGEALHLEPPLSFAIRPAALRVRIPGSRRSGGSRSS
ncbi:MAG: hypothetical protein JO017_03150 [Actinobacteria bacterium]|nr:hypothetical protein [Actinomycetota bacterium]